MANVIFTSHFNKNKLLSLAIPIDLVSTLEVRQDPYSMDTIFHYVVPVRRVLTVTERPDLEPAKQLGIIRDTIITDAKQIQQKGTTFDLDPTEIKIEVSL